jgi:hypothetical protein
MSAVKKTAAMIQAAIEELDTELAHIGYCLDLARENGFSELVAALCTDVQVNILPGIIVLMCLVTGAQRKAISKRYQRLRALISNWGSGQWTCQLFAERDGNAWRIVDDAGTDVFPNTRFITKAVATAAIWALRDEADLKRQTEAVGDSSAECGRRPSAEKECTVSPSASETCDG